MSPVFPIITILLYFLFITIVSFNNTDSLSHHPSILLQPAQKPRYVLAEVFHIGNAFLVFHCLTG